MHHPLVDPVVSIGIQMNPVRLDPPQPTRFLLHRLMQRQKRHIRFEAGLFQLCLVDRNGGIVVPEALREWHRSFIHGREAQHHHLRSRCHRPNQLFDSKALGLNRELASPIGTTDPGAVVEAHGQK